MRLFWRWVSVLVACCWDGAGTAAASLPPPPHPPPRPRRRPLRIRHHYLFDVHYLVDFHYFFDFHYFIDVYYLDDHHFYDHDDAGGRAGVAAAFLQRVREHVARHVAGSGVGSVCEAGGDYRRGGRRRFWRLLLRSVRWR